MARYFSLLRAVNVRGTGCADCLHIHYSIGMGKSKLKLPQKLGIGTLRHWNTVHKLLALT